MSTCVFCQEPLEANQYRCLHCGRTQPGWRSLSRRTVLVGLGVTGLAVAGGGFLWWARGHQGGNGSPQDGLIYGGHKGRVFAVAWSPQGQYVASGGADNVVQIWDATVGALVLKHPSPGQWVTTLAWSPDGRQLAIGSSIKAGLEVWDVSNGQSRLTITPEHDVFGVAWSPDGQQLVTPLEPLTIFDVATGQPKLTYPAPLGGQSVTWSPDGQTIASTSGDRTIQIWDARTAHTLLTYTAHQDGILAIAWSPDGRYLASGSVDKTVGVWDVATGKLIYRYSGHSGYVMTVAWSLDSQHIASAGQDNTVQVWEALSGRLWHRYTGHHNWVHSVSWSPDGEHIASGGDDQTVQVRRPG